MVVEETGQIYTAFRFLREGYNFHCKHKDEILSFTEQTVQFLQHLKCLSQFEERACVMKFVRSIASCLCTNVTMWRNHVTIVAVKSDR